MIISFLYALLLYVLARLITKKHFVPMQQLTEEIYYIKKIEKLEKIYVHKDKNKASQIGKNKKNSHQIFDIFSKKIIGHKKHASKQRAPLQPGRMFNA